MKIRMRTLAIGPCGRLDANHVYDLEEQQVRPLIDGGYAEEVVGKVKIASPEIETAAFKGAPETAVGRRQRRSG